MILKLNGQRVVIGAGKEFHFLGDLAFDQRKGDEAPEGQRSFLKGQFPRRWFRSGSALAGPFFYGLIWVSVFCVAKADLGFERWLAQRNSSCQSRFVTLTFV